VAHAPPGAWAEPVIIDGRVAAALDCVGVRDYSLRQVTVVGDNRFVASVFVPGVFPFREKEPAPMISRIVTCTIKPEKISEFRALLRSEVVPAIMRQPGFVDLVESIDDGGGTFVCTTLWNTLRDVEYYDQTLFPDLAQRLVPLLSGQPDIKTLMVENSTVHDISSGKSAAA
jgi:quinol monooxygenase YgiN